MITFDILRPKIITYWGHLRMEELYNDLYGSDVTIISNEFLNKYLSDTDPVYIKVFLFYLWKGFKENYSIEDASFEIDLSEEEIEKALKFWVKKKMIKKEYLDKLKQSKPDEKKLVDFDTKKKELINKNRKEYKEVESNLLFVAEKLLGKTLTERQIDLIATCYNNFCFDESIIHYLFEYCADIAKTDPSKTDARYMKKVAESWYEQNVKNVDDAKKITDKFTSFVKKKTKASIVNSNMSRDDYNEWFKNKFLSNK